MKQFSVILLLILLVFGCGKDNSSPIQRASGDEVGNGGNNVAIHFLSVANEVVELLNENEKSEYPVILPSDFDLVKLSYVLNSKSGDGLIVSTTSEQLIDKFDVRRDALNFPSKNLIVLNENIWKRYIDSGIDLSLLVFHELSPIAGALDDDGSLSKLFKDIIKNNNRREAAIVNSHRVMTSLPESSTRAQSIIEDLDLYRGLLSLETFLKQRTGRKNILGSTLLYVDIYKVEKLRGYYRFENKDETLKRTSTFAYPIEIENSDGQIITQNILEIDIEKFSKLRLKEKILQSFVALIYLRTDDFNQIEMDKLIDLAVSVTGCIGGEMADLCWEPVTVIRY